MRKIPLACDRPSGRRRESPHCRKLYPPRWFSILLFCFLAGTWGCAPSGETALRGDLRVACADSAIPLIQKEARAFIGLYPGARIEVASSDSRGALVKLFGGEADMAVIARDVAGEEKRAAQEGRADLRGFRIAIDGIACIVHPQNPVEGLSLGQVAGLLDGKLRSWAEVGGEDLPVTPVVRDRNSGTYDIVRQKVLGGSEFAAGLLCRSTQEVLDRVASNRSTIGCVGLAWLGGGRVKALQIAETPDSAYVGPTAANVYKNRYPIRRPILACVVNYQVESRLRVGFLAFLTSPRGQTVVEMEGLVPDKVPDRMVQLN